MRRMSTAPTARSAEASRCTPVLLVCTTRLSKNASSSRWVFSIASATENRGSAPRNTAASP